MSYVNFERQVGKPIHQEDSLYNPDVRGAIKLGNMSPIEVMGILRERASGKSNFER